MFPHKVKFEFTERPVAYARSGKEWALFVSLDNNDRWVITAWEKQPTKEDVARAEAIFTRSCEIYHRHIRVPPTFSLEVVGMLNPTKGTL